MNSRLVFPHARLANPRQSLPLICANKNDITKTLRAEGRLSAVNAGKLLLRSGHVSHAFVARVRRLAAVADVAVVFEMTSDERRFCRGDRTAEVE